MSFDANVQARQQVCPQCSASVAFAPGTRHVVCPYCGHTAEIAQADAEPVAERDFAAGLALLDATAPAAPHRAADCAGCGARIDLGEAVTATACPYCGLPVVSAEITRATLPVQAVLPFGIAREEATQRFATWIRSRWLAPRGFQRWHALENALRGVYVPYWTFDSRTVTAYTGERGEDYWETTYVTRTVNGKSQRVAQQVRRTRWYPASGVVRVDFDDLLVPATKVLPTRLLDALEPWDLTALQPYSSSFLTGFMAESYQTDLRSGFDLAGVRMQPSINHAIEADIGGDHQRIHSADTRHQDVTYKHVLLPVWIGVYRFRNKAYHACVNARTGEVHGERPWSALKITLWVLLAFAVAVPVVYALVQRGQRPAHPTAVSTPAGTTVELDPTGQDPAVETPLPER